MAENSDGTAKRRRGPGRPFPKGVSPNPGGRPPMSESKREAQELLAEGGPGAVRYLTSVYRDEMAPTKERIAAAKVFVDKLEAMKLDVKVDTTDDAGIIEMMKRMAGVEEKPKG